MTEIEKYAAAMGWTLEHAKAIVLLQHYAITYGKNVCTQQH